MRLFDMDSREDYLLDGKYKVATPCAPCVDVVEVVRCKDCKYRGIIDYPVCCESTDEWFCADGERKGGDTE